MTRAAARAVECFDASAASARGSSGLGGSAPLVGFRLVSAARWVRRGTAHHGTAWVAKPRSASTSAAAQASFQGSFARRRRPCVARGLCPPAEPRRRVARARRGGGSRRDDRARSRSWPPACVAPAAICVGDGGRVFVARIVHGDHEEVGSCGLARAPITGRLASSRPPARPKASRSRAGHQRAHRVERLFERLRRVREVDDDGERLARVDQVHAARHGRLRGGGLDQVVRRRAEAGRGARRRPASWRR